MLTPDLLHDYQKRAVNFQCSSPTTMLWLDMGLGKTIATLTSVAHLIATGFLRGVVVDSVDAGRFVVNLMRDQ